MTTPGADRRARLAVTAAALVPAARSPSGGGVAASAGALQAALDAEVAQGCPGLAAIVVNRAGVVWKGASGFADVAAQTPMRADDVCPIGSISKTFTSVVVLQLMQEGRLDLARTAADILGGEAVEGVPNADLATLAQLLSHTGGVPSWEDDPAWIREGRGDRYDPARRWDKAAVLDYVRGPGHAALNAPGAAFAYANTNYTLLGLVVEKVTGSTAEAEIRRRILEPLGMTHTGFEGFDVARAARPRRYHYATADFRRSAGVSPLFPQVRPGLIDVSASSVALEWTAGGMVSTVGDLAAYGLAIRDGRLLGPPATAVLEDWRAIPGGRGPAGRRAETFVGHGLFRTARPGVGVLIGHAGDVLGSTGQLAWPERGDALMAVLANVGTMHAGPTPPDAKSVGSDSAFTRLALAAAADEHLAPTA